MPFFSCITKTTFIPFFVPPPMIFDQFIRLFYYTCAQWSYIFFLHVHTMCNPTNGMNSGVRALRYMAATNHNYRLLQILNKSPSSIMTYCHLSFPSTNENHTSDILCITLLFTIAKCHSGSPENKNTTPMQPDQ